MGGNETKIESESNGDISRSMPPHSKSKPPRDSQIKFKRFALKISGLVLLLVLSVVVLSYIFGRSPISRLDPQDYSDNQLLMAFVKDMQAGKIKHFDISMRLLAILETNDPRIADLCITILSEKPKSDYELNKKLNLILSCVRGKQPFKSLSNLFSISKKDKTALLRVRAAWLLGVMRSERTIPRLALSLEDSFKDVRYAASWSLGEIGGKKALDTLISQLEENNAAAVQGLRKIADPLSVEALIHFVKENQKERNLAICALGEIGDKRAVETLIEILENCPYKPLAKEPSSLLKVKVDNAIFAADALGNIGDARAVGILEQIVSNNKVFWIRYHAKDALAKLKK